MAVLRDIRERQRKMEIKSPYICPSPQDHRKPISYTAIRDALDRIKEEYEIDDVTTHTFRATVATATAEHTNDLIGIRDAFGWKSLAMPNRYIKRAGVNARRTVDLQAQFLPAELGPARHAEG